MFRKICLIFLAFLLLLAFPTKSFAVTVSITNYPSSISADPFSISVSILGASSGTNYIRVDLYKDGTQNYFGDTYNGSDWYNGSEGKQYYPITIIDSKSTASATLQTRTGVPSISDYDGQGSYKMRVRRYTASGGLGSEDPNNTSVAVTISIPSPTPTEDSSIQILAFDTSPTPENKPQTAVLGQSSGNAGFYFILSGALLLVAGIYIFIRKNKFSLKDKFGI